MHLEVRDEISLTDIRPTDKPAFIEHLSCREIYENTLRIPYPYTADDADEWLALVAQSTRQHGRPVHWAIREGERLIGCCGFDHLALGRSHRAEIGYWLARPDWGRGIMTSVIGRLCDHAFGAWGLSKLSAYVFAHNAASARVLEKCGFEQEGYLHRHFLKDGLFLDARLLARLAPIERG